MVCRFYFLMFSMLFSRPPAGGFQAIATKEADSLSGNNYTSIAFTPSASSISAAELRNRNKAVLDITTVPRSAKAVPKHFHLKAMFTKAGNQDFADGTLLQIHPCGAMDFRREWIAVYKLEDPEQGCHRSIIIRAKLALAKGASAVIFDVRDNKNASKELKRTRNPLGKPVLTIDGKAAKKLQALLQDYHEATIEINSLAVKKKTSIQENITSQNKSDKADEINSAILLGVVAGIVVLVAVSAIFILKCRRVNGKLSRRKLVERLLKRMKTSFYDGSADLDESRSDGRSCVVCLVDYVLGQEIRTLPCSHKFHRCCVDPWLLTNRTCPLCVFDITDAKRHMKKKRLSSIQHTPPSVEAPIRHVLQVDDNTETIHSFSSFNSHSALTRSSGDVSDGCGMLNVTIAMHEDRSAFTCNCGDNFEYSDIRPSDPPSCSVHQRTCGRYSSLNQAAASNRCLVEKQFILPHSYDRHCSIHCNSRFPAERLKPSAWNRSNGYDADVSSVETIESSADPALATDSSSAPALSCTSSVELSNCTNVAEFGSNSSCHSICFVNPSTDDLIPVHLQPSCLADVVSTTLPGECT